MLLAYDKGLYNNVTSLICCDMLHFCLHNLNMLYDRGHLLIIMMCSSFAAHSRASVAPAAQRSLLQLSSHEACFLCPLSLCRECFRTNIPSVRVINVKQMSLHLLSYCRRALAESSSCSTPK